VLFNSYVFVFVFAPVTIAGFVLCERHREAQIVWLTFASFCFYGWWNWRYVGLLVASMLFNFGMGLVVPGRRGVLALAIAGDLALLSFFKYWGFLAANSATLFAFNVPVPAFALPLGISFYTFTQIAFLVDSYRREAKEPRLINYALFVTYFPHLIAGPLFHHAQMMPQFKDRSRGKLRADNIALGVTLFIIGLFKKVIIADSLAPYADKMFAVSHLTMIEAWFGVLCYSLQLYFDFSGYCDMAIGLSRLFNVEIPVNFNSPYKAASIIEFWQRWNMTLSRFLRDYLYIALGGNRRGAPRRYANLMITMLLGGLWHGASWTFVIWGGLHGLYLVINHAWRAFAPRTERSAWSVCLSVLLTFLSVQVAWVFFRATSFEAAVAFVKSMFGAHGVRPNDIFAAIGGKAIKGRWAVAEAGVALAAVWTLPNSQEIMGLVEGGWLRWRPSPAWAMAFSFAACVCIAKMGEPTSFLYYQF
jgi:alginate O-acetyltransferase complex protein AlgI